MGFNRQRFRRTKAVSVSQGRTANSSGTVLEAVVRHALFHLCIPYDKPTKTGMYGLGDSEIIPDLKVGSVVGYEFGFYIECRRQRSSGSAKDKMYKTLLNIKRNYDLPTCIVLDGQELAVIHREFNESLCNKLIGCYWLSDFIAFAEAIAEGDARMFVAESFNANQKTFFGVGL